MTTITTLRCSTGEFAVATDGPSDAPPLLFSNSLSSNLGMWDDQVAALAGRFRIIRYNGRGQEGSSCPPPPYTMAQLAGDALAILDALGIGAARFCGLSMGGMVGQWLLSHAPARMAAAVLANTAAAMPPPGLWDGRIVSARQGGMAATVEPTVTRWFPPDFHRSAPATVERMRAMIRTTPVEGYVGCCGAIRDMDQRATLPAIRSPTLVIVGEHDTATTPEDGAFIHRAIAGSRLVSMPTGHISAVERPDLFNAALLDFFG